MRKTRSELAGRLEVLKARVSELVGVKPNGGTKLMAAKKMAKKAAGSSAKKKAATAGGAKAKTSAKRAGANKKASQGRKSTTLTGIERKAKQVLGKALAGAAEGAVRGAVEAVVPSTRGKASKKREESDQ